MAYNVYKSTDAGAPTGPTNAAGTLITILDALLVNGYSPGIVSSITRSGSTATLTFSSAHKMTSKGNRLTISGCTQTEYNGTFEVTIASTTSVTFTVTGTPATPATGSPVATKPGAGWTKAYSGTNLAAYRQGSANQRYVRINDTGTTSARVVGYEAMTDINTGTGAFPTNTQIASGLYILKSNSTPARPYVMVATDNWFIFRTLYDGYTLVPTFFGDFTSYNLATDNYNTILMSPNNESAYGDMMHIANDGTSLSPGHYKPRSYTQIGTAVKVGATVNSCYANASGTIGSGGCSYPDPVRSSLLYSPLLLIESGSRQIGYLPQLLCPFHNNPLLDLDTFIGDGDFAGQTFMAMNGYNGQVFVRIA